MPTLSTMRTIAGSSTRPQGGQRRRHRGSARQGARLRARASSSERHGGQPSPLPSLPSSVPDSGHTVAGTLAYMAPEILRGGKTPTSRPTCGRSASFSTKWLPATFRLRVVECSLGARAVSLFGMRCDSGSRDPDPSRGGRMGAKDREHRACPLSRSAR